MTAETDTGRSEDAATLFVRHGTIPSSFDVKRNEWNRSDPSAAQQWHLTDSNKVHQFEYRPSNFAAEAVGLCFAHPKMKTNRRLICMRRQTRCSWTAFFLVKMTEIPNESGQGPELDGCAECWMRFRSNSWEIFQRMGRAMGTTKKRKGSGCVTRRFCSLGVNRFTRNLAR